MSLKRFLFLLIAVRFDDINTRNERLQNDRLAYISGVFNSFIQNCQDNYSCGEYLTVDEMLMPFRGHCRFRVYMKSKPAKYGLKVFCLCDSRTHYLLNAFVYVGENSVENPERLLIPTATVLSLVEPVTNSKRNITADNYFTSIELVDKLKERQLTYVGTIRQNKRDVPAAFKPNKDRPVQSSVFGFTRDKTLVSYVPKKNRSVTILSTMHHDMKVNAENENKPEMIEFYNLTKGGVDCLDQKCAIFSVGRRSRRWPQVLWFGLLNISGVNAHVILNSVDLQTKLDRRNFLKNLGLDLVQPHLKRRSQLSSLPRELRMTVQRIVEARLPPEERPGPAALPPEERPGPAALPQEEPRRPAQNQPPPKRRRCSICPRQRDQKHPTECEKCSRAVCKAHSTVHIVCHNCIDD